MTRSLQAQAVPPTITPTPASPAPERASRKYSAVARHRCPTRSVSAPAAEPPSGFSFANIAIARPSGPDGTALAEPPAFTGDGAPRAQNAQAVQLENAGTPVLTSATELHHAASAGLQGCPQALPHLARIQEAFGPHGPHASRIKAYIGGPARDASHAMGAAAYAMGDAVAFTATPSLRTAAHEAAHVVQQHGGVQLEGGIGKAGDVYERHADAVADRVCEGRTAADLLARVAPIPASTQGTRSLAPVTKASVQCEPLPQGEKPAALFEAGALLGKTQQSLRAREKQEKGKKNLHEQLDFGQLTELESKDANNLIHVREIIADIKQKASASSARLTQLYGTMGTVVIFKSEELETLEKNLEATMTILTSEKTATELKVAKGLVSELIDLRSLVHNSRFGSGGKSAINELFGTIRSRIKAFIDDQDKIVAAASQVDLILKTFLFHSPVVSGVTEAPTVGAVKQAEKSRYKFELPKNLAENMRTLEELLLGVGRANVANYNSFSGSIGDFMLSQLQVRGNIDDATGRAVKGAVPTWDELVNWFESFKSQTPQKSPPTPRAPGSASIDENSDEAQPSKSNNNMTPEQAYMELADAFFYHKHEDSLADLDELTIEQIFGRKTTITGTRGLVCSGFALLGATLLGYAGATLDRYIIGVKATPDQLKNDTNFGSNAAHAIAVLDLRGTKIYVSNQSILYDLDSAFPKGFVYRGNDKAKTLKEARDSVQKVLMQARESLHGLHSTIN